MDWFFLYIFFLRLFIICDIFVNKVNYVFVCVDLFFFFLLLVLMKKKLNIFVIWILYRDISF